jgi:hypothetical protein
MRVCVNITAPFDRSSVTTSGIRNANMLINTGMIPEKNRYVPRSSHQRSNKTHFSSPLL